MKKILSLVLIGAVAMGLLSACSGADSVASADSTTPTTQTGGRTLTVTGIGKITTIPDVAYITIGVHTEGKVVAEALQSNTAQATKVAEALKGLGVDAKDIQTTNFNIYPQQTYNPQGQLEGTQYIVDNSVYVTVHDLSKVGDILSAVVSSGANNINGIQYDISNKDKVLSEARTLAVQNALLQATDLAKAANVNLGPVETINAVNNVPVPIYEAKIGAAMASANASVPVSAGELTVTVQVTATYEIK